jgi:hypothetical protein
MNRICWWLANLFSRSLDRGEREAVTGDLFESGESGLQALRDVVGLVVRRQTEIWSNWRPWMTVTCVLLPLGVVLSIVSRNLVGMSSVYGWLYLHNWDWRLLHNRGFWYVLGDSLRSLFAGCLRVACLSWSAGFLLGRKVRYLKTGALGFLFCLMLLLGAQKLAPTYLAFESHGIQQMLHLARIPAQRNSVSPSLFYGTILPLISMAMFIALPTVLGMHRGRAESISSGTARFAVPAAVATLVGTVLQVPGVIFLLLLELGVRSQMWRGGPPPVHLAIVLLGVITYWPLAYLLTKIVTSFQQRLAAFGRSHWLETNGR